MKPEIIDWRAFFAGAWRMSRRIDDRREARTGAAWGEAAFLAFPGGGHADLLCAEALTIDYGGSRLTGEQKTIWRFENSLGPDLYFSDAREFCKIRFQRDGGVWRAAFFHDCSEDRYEGSAAVFDENNWRLVWTVKGPRKDYSLDTEYSRLSEK